jgi:sporulation protein YabP
MEKLEPTTTTKQEKTFTESQLTLLNRKTLTLTGVEKVFETNENKVQVKVSGSNLLINGEGLNISRLDVETGLIEIEGLINDFKYTTGETKTNLFKKIFK